MTESTSEIPADAQASEPAVEAAPEAAAEAPAATTTLAPLDFRFRSERENSAVPRIAAAAGMVASDEAGHFNWDDAAPAAEDFSFMEGHYFNHLPGSDALGMNGRFFRAMNAAKARAERVGRAGPGDRFDIFPRTWLLPDDIPAYQAAVKRMPAAPYIWRYRGLAPAGKVAILNSPHDAGADAQYLVQEYLGEPHLLDGYKYTLRFFLAVSSVEPLVAWLSTEGFCRYASQPFAWLPEQRHERRRHITTPEALLDDETVSLSWQNSTLAAYRERLRRENIDDTKLFAQIETALQTALLAVREQIVKLAADDKAAFAPGQFQLYAADVLVDEALKPWLLGLHPTPWLAVGPARNLAVAAREEALYERVTKDLLTLLGAFERGAPGPPPTGLVNWSSWLDLHESRRGSFQRLVPSSRSSELLLTASDLRGADLQLAWLARAPEQRRLVPQNATAIALDGGLVVACEDGSCAVLEQPAAAVWQALANGENPETLAAALGPIPEGSEASARETQLWSLLADWFRGGLIGWSLPAAKKQRAPVRWNGGRAYRIDGLNLLVRGGSAEIEALLHPLLAPFEQSPLGGAAHAPDRVFDLVNHDDGYALFDSEGKRRWRGHDASLGAVLLELIQRETMRASSRLGAVEALFLREKKILIVPSRGLYRGLAEALAPLGFESAGAPVFLSAREGLEVATLASGEDAAQASQLILLEVDRSLEESRSKSSPFAALNAIFANARSKPQLTAKSAAVLTAALAKTPCEQLSSHGVQSAAKQIVEVITGAPHAQAEPPKLAIVH